LDDNRVLLVADFEFTVHDSGPGRPRAFFPEVIEAGALQLLPPDYLETPIIQTFVRPQYFPKIKPECYNITMFFF
jgi:sporulation inhibitor KapD